MNQVLEEFQSHIDAILGTMVRVCFSLPGQQNDFRRLATELGIPLSTPLSSACFDPSQPGVIHESPIQDQIDALEDGGSDEILIGNICASFIYSMWEDKYRSAFAHSRGVKKDCISSDVFGELATYRHAVIHNQAFGTSKTATLVILPSIQRGAPVRVTRHLLEAIVQKVKEELHVLSKPD